MSAWRSLTTRRGRRHLALTAGGVTAAAAAGGLATTPSDGWYLALEKPPWQPPPVTFGLVWTPLYADIAAVSAAVLTTLEQEGRSDEARAFRRALVANLVLNAGWSVMFWQSRRLWLSTAWCGVLTASSLDLVRRSGRVDPGLRSTLAPYPAWCAFATALNASIAQRNPR